MVFAESGLPSATARDVERAGNVERVHPAQPAPAVPPKAIPAMPVLREVVGGTLRALRMRQQRTLREVSSTARVSLGYLSEVERGQKEPSSELLAAICGALDVELSELFAEVSDILRRQEKLVLSQRLSPVPGSRAARLTPAPADAGTGSTVRVQTMRTVAA